MSENNKSLPMLALEMSEIIAQLTENGGELSEVLEQAFDCTGQELQLKADRYAFFMERLDAEADFWKAKADAYSKVAKSCKTLKERLKENIKGAMHMLGTDEIEGGEYRFKLSRLAPKLVIQEELLPDNFKMVVTETVPDKEKIKAELEIGTEIPGAKHEMVFSLRPYLNSKKGK